MASLAFSELSAQAFQGGGLLPLPPGGTPDLPGHPPGHASPCSDPSFALLEDARPSACLLFESLGRLSLHVIQLWVRHPVTCRGSRLLSFNPYRYLDNVVNKQSVSPPIPHLHALLTSGDDPPEEVDIFDLLKVSYEVSTHQGYLARLLHRAMWVQLAVVGGWPLLCGST